MTSLDFFLQTNSQARQMGDAFDQIFSKDAPCNKAQQSSGKARPEPDSNKTQSTHTSG